MATIGTITYTSALPQCYVPRYGTLMPNGNVFVTPGMDSPCYIYNVSSQQYTVTSAIIYSGKTGNTFPTKYGKPVVLGTKIIMPPYEVSGDLAVIFDTTTSAISYSSANFGTRGWQWGVAVTNELALFTVASILVSTGDTIVALYYLSSDTVVIKDPLLPYALSLAPPIVTPSGVLLTPAVNNTGITVISATIYNIATGNISAAGTVGTDLEYPKTKRGIGGVTLDSAGNVQVFPMGGVDGNGTVAIYNPSARTSTTGAYIYNQTRSRSITVVALGNDYNLTIPLANTLQTSNLFPAYIVNSKSWSIYTTSANFMYSNNLMYSDGVLMNTGQVFMIPYEGTGYSAGYNRAIIYTPPSAMPAVHPTSAIIGTPWYTTGVAKLGDGRLIFSLDYQYNQTACIYNPSSGAVTYTSSMYSTSGAPLASFGGAVSDLSGNAFIYGYGYGGVPANVYKFNYLTSSLYLISATATTGNQQSALVTSSNYAVFLSYVGEDSIVYDISADRVINTFRTSATPDVAIVQNSNDIYYGNYNLNTNLSRYSINTNSSIALSAIAVGTTGIAGLAKLTEDKILVLPYITSASVYGNMMGGIYSISANAIVSTTPYITVASASTTTSYAGPAWGAGNNKAVIQINGVGYAIYDYYHNSVEYSYAVGNYFQSHIGGQNTACIYDDNRIVTMPLINGSPAPYFVDTVIAPIPPAIISNEANWSDTSRNLQMIHTSQDGWSFVISTYPLLHQGIDLNGMYAGGVIDADGSIHFTPVAATIGQKITRDGTVLAYTIPDNWYFGSGALGRDSSIYFYSLYKETCMRIQSNGNIQLFAGRDSYSEGQPYTACAVDNYGYIIPSPYKAQILSVVDSNTSLVPYTGGLQDPPPNPYLQYMAALGQYDGAVVDTFNRTHFIPGYATVGQYKSDSMGSKDSDCYTYELAYIVPTSGEVTEGAYVGGVVARNGDLHFTPNGAKVGQKVSKDLVCTTYSLAVTASHAFGSGCLGPDGVIYWAHNHATIGQCVDENDHTSTFNVPYTDQEWGAYSGILPLSSTELHYIPYNSRVGIKLSFSLSEQGYGDTDRYLSSEGLIADCTYYDTVRVLGIINEQSYGDTKRLRSSVSEDDKGSWGDTRRSLISVFDDSIGTYADTVRVFQKPKNNGWDYLVSTYSILSKFTSGVDGAYIGGVLDDYGNIHMVPGSAKVGQKVGHNSVVTTYSLAIVCTTGINADRALYASGSKLQNGVIHFAPLVARQLGTYGIGQYVDPSTDTAYSYLLRDSQTTSQGAAYWGAATNYYNQLVFSPFEAKAGQYIDGNTPLRDTDRGDGNPDTYPLTNNAALWGYNAGILDTFNRVHFVPGLNSIGQYRPSILPCFSANSYTYPISGIIPTHSQRVMYSGGVLDASGYVHFCATIATVGAKVSPALVVSTYSLAFNSVYGSTGGAGVLAPDGQVYMLPVMDINGTGQIISQNNVVTTYSLGGLYSGFPKPTNGGSPFSAMVRNDIGEVHFIPAGASVGLKMSFFFTEEGYSDTERVLVDDNGINSQNNADTLRIVGLLSQVSWFDSCIDNSCPVTDAQGQYADTCRMLVSEIAESGWSDTKRLFDTYEYSWSDTKRIFTEMYDNNYSDTVRLLFTIENSYGDSLRVLLPVVDEQTYNDAVRDILYSGADSSYADTLRLLTTSQTDVNYGDTVRIYDFADTNWGDTHREVDVRYEMDWSDTVRIKYNDFPDLCLFDAMRDLKYGSSQTEFDTRRYKLTMWSV